MARTFVPILMVELQNRINTALALHEDDFIEMVMNEGKIKKDLAKVNFDFENCEWTPSDFWWQRHLGYRTVGDLHYLSCYAGGDWENPVNFIIYFDGKQLRGYVPKIGNVWNYDTKEAFGNDEDADEVFIRKYFRIDDNTWHEQVNQMLNINDMEAEIRVHIRQK